MKVIAALVVLLISTLVGAQVPKPRVQASYPGLGAYSQKFSDVFSATSNPASLASIRAGAFAVYGEEKFMLKELSTLTGILAFPIKSGAIGFQGDYFGSPAYNETQLGFMYARKVSKLVDVGVKFNYYAVQIAGYGTASAINFEAGTIVHLSDKLHAGAYIYNPTNSRLGKNNIEKIAFIYKAGLGYEVSSVLYLSAELEKQQSQQLNIRAGMQYNLHKKVFIRSGITTLTNNSFVSICFKPAFGRIDVTTSYHPQLGLTPGLLLLINIGKQEED